MQPTKIKHNKQKGKQTILSLSSPVATLVCQCGRPFLSVNNLCFGFSSHYQGSLRCDAPLSDHINVTESSSHNSHNKQANIQTKIYMPSPGSTPLQPYLAAIHIGRSALSCPQNPYDRIHLTICCHRLAAKLMRLN